MTDNGLRLFYRKYGDGPDVVLVPGGFFLEADLRTLATPARTVVFYDMRNRGRSDPVPDSTQISLSADVADLETIRTFVAAVRVQLIGYSYLGKMVAVYAAEHPDAVTHIVQLGPVPPVFSTKYPDSLVARSVRADTDSAAWRALREMQRDGMPIRRPSEYCRAEWRVTRVGLVGNPSRAAAVSDDICDFPNEWPVNLVRHFGLHLASMQKADFGPEQFAQVAMPVLTVHGTLDRNAPFGSGRDWASRFPDGRLLTVTGGAHNSWVDAPDVVMPAIDEFLAGRWPARAERVAPATKHPGSP